MVTLRDIKGVLKMSSAEAEEFCARVRAERDALNKDLERRAKNLQGIVGL